MNHAPFYSIDHTAVRQDTNSVRRGHGEWALRERLTETGGVRLTTRARMVMERNRVLLIISLSTFFHFLL